MNGITWREVGILDLVSIASGQVDPRLPAYRNLPLIAPDHIESGTGRLISVRTAAEQGAISGKYIVQPGDIVYSKIRPYLRKAHLAKFRALCSADMYPLRPKSGVSAEYVLSTLLSERFTKFAISTSMRSGIPKLNRSELAEFRLSAPGSREQLAIGGALAEADQLIERTGSLIAKKRAIKQGMMQELLTGRTRLPGFSASWAESGLGSVAKVVGGGTPSTQVHNYWGGGIPWFTPAEISPAGSGLVTRSDRTITSDGLSSSSAHLLPAGSVLVTSRASIGNCAIAGVPAATNQGFASLVPQSSKSTWFLYYWVQQNKAELESRSAGSTFLEISARKVAAIPLLAPCLDEQEAIGSALRDADDELAALERRLEATRAIKQGMMQELLTGRTRLMLPEASA